MKKKSYKIAKLEKNRTSILTDDLDTCYLCGRTKNHLHEVFFGTNRQNSMKYACVVPLCLSCHNEVHNNIEIDKQLKIETQTKFEEVYQEEFISVFHKNYK